MHGYRNQLVDAVAIPERRVFVDKGQEKVDYACRLRKDSFRSCATPSCLVVLASIAVDSR